MLNANKAVRCSIFRRFSNLDECRPEADGDVISGMALNYVSTDVSVGFGDSRLNISAELFDFHFAHFCAVFTNILQPTGSNW